MIEGIAKLGLLLLPTENPSGRGGSGKGGSRGTTTESLWVRRWLALRDPSSRLLVPPPPPPPPAIPPPLTGPITEYSSFMAENAPDAVAPADAERVLVGIDP